MLVLVLVEVDIPLEMIFQTHGLVVFLINPLFNLMKMK